MRGAEGRAGTYHDKHDGLVVSSVRSLLQDCNVFLSVELYTPWNELRRGKYRNGNLFNALTKVVNVMTNKDSHTTDVSTNVRE